MKLKIFFENYRLDYRIEKSIEKDLLHFLSIAAGVLDKH